MALNWDTEKIENHEEICWERREATPTQAAGRYLKPLTEAFIWTSISIGIGQWNEVNAAEVYARLKIIEALDGSFIMRMNDDTGKFEQHRISPQDVIDHIGLSVNVSYESRKDWAQRIFIGRGDGLARHGTKVSAKVNTDEWHDTVDVSKTTELSRQFKNIVNHVKGDPKPKASI